MLGSAGFAGDGGGKVTFIDMFCGMGTVRMGFEQAGHECVYSVEWDKHKRKIYEVIFGNEPEASDICAVRGADLPISDCWCFGAPCQDFSLAGLRSGMEGDRSSLVREVFRLVRETSEEHRPEWLLYENVKGMLSSNKGLDYLEILFEMASLGYDIQYELLNSKDFGVPQNRERVYTLGHLRTRGKRKVFPIGRDSGTSIKVVGFDGNQSKKVKDRGRIFGTDGISGTFMATDYKQPKSILDPNGLVRHLTPREYMRGQGVPDYITDKLISAGISDTQMYRAAGDACTVNVIYEIAKAMTGPTHNMEATP